jgi:hypothetical protein
MVPPGRTLLKIGISRTEGGFDPLGRVEAVERLGDAREEFPRPFGELRLGDLLVGPGDLDGRVDGDQLRDGLRQRDREEAAVLPDAGDRDGAGPGGEDATPSRPHRVHDPKVFVEMKVEFFAEQLWQIIRPGGGRRLALLVDCEAREPEPLARGEGPLFRVFQREVVDALGWDEPIRSGDERVLSLRPSSEHQGESESRAQDNALGGRHMIRPPGSEASERPTFTRFTPAIWPLLASVGSSIGRRRAGEIGKVRHVD